MLPRDLRLAWRRLRVAPAFALFSIATLAVTIGVTTAAYSLVYHLWPSSAIVVWRVLSVTLFDSLSAIDLGVFSGAAVIFLGAGVLACAKPALRAARVDPNVMLRDE